MESKESLAKFPKNGDILLCSNYISIGLTSLITKKIQIIIRVRSKIDPEISEEQFRLRKGKGV